MSPFLESALPASRWNETIQWLRGMETPGAEGFAKATYLIFLEESIGSGLSEADRAFQARYVKAS